MQKDKFYILIENRYYRHENENDDFHIERLFEFEEVVDLLRNSGDVYNQTSIIVTNDTELLSTYITAINEDELKMLCRIDNFEERNIRINKAFFNYYKDEVFEFFDKIKNREIVSASMNFSSETVNPYDHDPTIGISIEHYNGWITNKEFSYFKTPIRYLNKEQSNKTFYLDDIKEADLETFEKLININILEIGNSEEKPDLNWEFRKDLLRYYDKISCKRLYISKENLDKIVKDNSIVFNIETKLDANFYIEYYVTGVKEDIDEYYDDYQEPREDNRPNYSKYNGAYGFDDDTIDSAFEGDPENYWNID